MCTSMNDTIYLSSKYVCKNVIKDIYQNLINLKFNNPYSVLYLHTKFHIEIIINSFLYALLMTLCKLIKHLLHPPLTPAPVPEVVFESRTVSRRNTMMIGAWWHIPLRTNPRPELRSRDLFWPIRSTDDTNDTSQLSWPSFLPG